MFMIMIHYLSLDVKYFLVTSCVLNFRLWTEADLRPINLNCRVEGFASDTVILGNTSEVPEHVYFVVSGLCKLIRVSKLSCRL